jgi:UDP-N-acetylglucosamine--N-acetylmuramyl-(pentapeptide) pyrophosphoryl-undecaprenol N-acetylglucosamine transferase
LDKNKLTIFSVGGSLGSRTLNNGWKDNLNKLIEKDYQLIWQTGKSLLSPKGRNNPDNSREIAIENENSENVENKTNSISNFPPLGERGLGIIIREFISDMALHYSAADVIVSRAGAIAISELAMAKKPVILVPFPFAAEDHQTKNAMALVEKNAARMVKDSEMDEKFWLTLTEICENENLRKEMSKNLEFFAKPNATKEIVDEIVQCIK